MNKSIKWLFSSFDNHSEGASARKLTAFALMLCVAWLHYKYVTPENAVQFLTCDLAAILIILGIVTAQQVIDFKNGQTTASNEQTNS